MNRPRLHQKRVTCAKAIYRQLTRSGGSMGVIGRKVLLGPGCYS